MLLDPQIYEQVRQRRDPHFDGKIFIAVLTTGIYCRPICPVRVPLQKNIQIYNSAAAAAEAGFRPCLRCRPESAPGTTANPGADAIVNKALALIGKGAPGDTNMAELARFCQISSRQLHRLFQRHVGASPTSIAHTRRLHFAKKLIDETSLDMSDICYAAGFNSVRRFNSVIKNTWQRSPMQLRKAARQSGSKDSSADDCLGLSLSYRPPFDWRAMLEFLAYRAIPGVESVNPASGEYARTVAMADVTGVIRVCFHPHEHHLRLEFNTELAPHLFSIVQGVRQMFDLDACSDEIEQHLSHDEQLKLITSRYPGIRVPGAWEGFEVAVRAILGQQVSVRAATTLVSRLVQRLGKPLSQTLHEPAASSLALLFPTPAVLASANMNGLGITGTRVAAIQSLARHLHDGDIRLDGSMPDPEVKQRLCRITGIGAWTADYIALRALHDPDALPAADLILLRSAGGGEPLSPAQLQARASTWRPWRAYAVLSLWHDYSKMLSHERDKQEPV
ncbi:MAG: AlkA N-terminal domain-containing protein [Pseudomonadales bacterium]|nr:AlkA N-terminal domain-containing protein [Pseudomonadales bacterium]